MLDEGFLGAEVVGGFAGCAVDGVVDLDPGAGACYEEAEDDEEVVEVESVAGVDARLVGETDPEAETCEDDADACEDGVERYCHRRGVQRVRHCVFLCSVPQGSSFFLSFPPLYLQRVQNSETGAENKFLWSMAKPAETLQMYIYSVGNGQGPLFQYFILRP